MGNAFWGRKGQWILSRLLACVPGRRARPRGLRSSSWEVMGGRGPDSVWRARLHVVGVQPSIGDRRIAVPSPRASVNSEFSPCRSPYYSAYGSAYSAYPSYRASQNLVPINQSPEASGDVFLPGKWNRCVIIRPGKSLVGAPKVQGTVIQFHSINVRMIIPGSPESQPQKQSASRLDPMTIGDDVPRAREVEPGQSSVAHCTTAPPTAPPTAGTRALTTGEQGSAPAAR